MAVGAGDTEATEADDLTFAYGRLDAYGVRAWPPPTSCRWSRGCASGNAPHHPKNPRPVRPASPPGEPGGDFLGGCRSVYRQPVHHRHKVGGVCFAHKTRLFANSFAGNRPPPRPQVIHQMTGQPAFHRQYSCSFVCIRGSLFLAAWRLCERYLPPCIERNE